MCDPTTLGIGASLVGNLFASNSASNAVSAAQAAQQAAIQQAEQYAQAGYTANQGTIANTGTQSTDWLNQGYQGATNALAPAIYQGDAARNYYANGTGVNGADAQSAYMHQLMQRPEYQAANQYALQGVQQQFGSKQNSGALARALQSRETQFAQGYANNDLSNTKPLMDAGNQARALQASNAQQLGTNQATNAWKTGNAFIGNQNTLTNDFMQGALGSGNVSANGALAQGQIDQNSYSTIGNTVGRLLGGVNGVNAFGSIGGSGGSGSNS